VTKRWGDTTVVADVSFELGAGELLAVVGESGSGKSTLLKMINRLLEPSAGSVRVAGRDVRDSPGHLLRREIGYVFQGVGLFPHLTVGENVGIVPWLLGWSKASIAERVRELLELVELDATLATRAPASLSGGQAQRVGLARALAGRPNVLLLDEPFGALDPLTRDRLQQVLDRLRHELALSVVLVTHDLSEALLLADRILVLRRGRVVQLGTPGTLYAQPADEYVEMLLSAPRRQARILERLAAQPRARSGGGAASA
ncbi:MAG TPA: ABC transporter ATP-binding protein, partial [Polyangiaceae bacterium]|nr:ABC transporter ATP-binding protein [Polyangiaceae bacterium]